MRNKAKNFPNIKMTSAPEDESQHLALRPNGTINSKPQEKAARSRERDVNQVGRYHRGK
ncbi:small, acid-soluble spore protein K [Halobacillus yeomjeoni]|uniref:Small, acid-soluble spore protein K n=1 Tax=Halobacillus yeomjeoni TaxID=311194 RepID=A0A931HWK0_9BACI|nr:small acid-soluble spore protein K [Halobacillus yeomjeoni]MBH0231112.1 small, acid-soluble spore protein K [Halobacillus yeomjeoni]MCA0984025.1 small, acid-soluble spore protein K [Halobacillus yeomjeoni]